jgi:hypothetical protein
VEWEIYGKPIQNVYKQLCATAQLDGILTVNQKEVEFRNDWLYDTTYMKTIAKSLLKRELIKGWVYKLVMLDDPILEVDDIIQVGTEKFYITSIRKTLKRPSQGLMTATAWRIA